MTKTSLFADLSEALSSAVAQTSQSVVTVLASRNISGVVVAHNEILTVAHVLHSDEVRILTPDGRELSAQVVGRQHASDLALLRVTDLHVAPITASQGVQVGGLLSVVARTEHGVQAALGFISRSVPERGFMPTGAAPFRGVSGGGVFDARGGFVGLANAGMSRSELLAVPAERALKIAGLLSHDGKVPRGYLGIGTQPVHFPEHTQSDQTQPESQNLQANMDGERFGGRRGQHGRWGHPSGERGEGIGRGFGPRGGRGGPEGDWNVGGWGERGPHGGWNRGGWQRGNQNGPMPRRGKIGLAVVQVEQGSPAQNAGILIGDVLLTLGGTSIHHPVQLMETVRDRAGETITLGILRGGAEQDVSVTLGER